MKIPLNRPVFISDSVNEETYEEIVNFYKKNKDNRISILSKHFNLPEYSINKTIDHYYKVLQYDRLKSKLTENSLC